MESRTGFSQGPLSALELSKDPPKDKHDFNRFRKASSYLIFPLQKKFLFPRQAHFFPTLEVPHKCACSFIRP